MYGKNNTCQRPRWRRVQQFLVLVLTLVWLTPCGDVYANLPTVDAHRKLYLDAIQLQTQSKWNSARRKLKRLTRLMEKELGSTHPELVIPIQSLAQLEYGRMDFHAARVHWQRVVTCSVTANRNRRPW